MSFRHSLVRLLLVPLPRRLRDRFGEDLHRTAVEAADDAWSRGGAAGVASWAVREGRDVLRLAWHDRALLVAASGARTISHVSMDARHALRVARRRPAFALAVVGTLALTLGAVTTVIALATAVLWRPLPFPDEDRLAILWEQVEDDGRLDAWRVTSATFVGWQEGHEHIFADLAAFASATFTATGAGDAVRLAGVRATAGYFRVLGVQPLLGRTFTPDDERPGADDVIVVSEALWRSRLGSRMDVIGHSLRLDDRRFEIIGVAPAGLYPARPVTPARLAISADSQQFWIPIPRTAAFVGNQRSHVYGVVARLVAGLTPEEAERRVAQARVTADGHALSIVGLRQQLTRDVRPLLLAVVAAAAILLLICCANVASLYAVHVDGRARELAVRSALGAGGWRIARQLVAETLTLVGLGAALGLGLTHAALPTLGTALPDAVPLLTRLVIDWRVVCASLLMWVGLAPGLALWPVLRLGRNRTALLRAPSAGGPRRGHRWLVVAELALALTLSVTAGLLARSLLNVERQHPGFDADRLIAFDVQLPASRARDLAETIGFERRLTEALRVAPGVRDVSIAYDLPLEANWIDGFSFVEQSGPAPENQSAWLRIVSPSYFTTVGVPLVDGRVFGPADDLSRPGALVVNRAFVDTFLHDRPVLGTRLRSSAPTGNWGAAVPSEFTIVGVVGNERFLGIEQPTPPAYYLSTAQFPQGGFTCLLRTSAEPRQVASSVAGVVRAVEPAVPISGLTTLRDVLADQLGNRRLTTVIVMVFGAAAILLAALGVYGLLTLIVNAHTKEIGVRIALGAAPSHVAGTIVRHALVQAGTGLLIGLLGAWVSTRALESLLFDVRRFDPLTLAGAAALLGTMVVAAAWRPARRAAAVDPVQALRSEP